MVASLEVMIDFYDHVGTHTDLFCINLKSNGSLEQSVIWETISWLAMAVYFLYFSTLPPCCTSSCSSPTWRITFRITFLLTSKWGLMFWSFFTNCSWTFLGYSFSKLPCQFFQIWGQGIIIWIPSWVWALHGSLSTSLGRRELAGILGSLGVASPVGELLQIDSIIVLIRKANHMLHVE